MRTMEVKSPLKWVGVRFYVAEDGEWRIRFGKGKRRPAWRLRHPAK